jgi:hypothetical protein
LDPVTLAAIYGGGNILTQLFGGGGMSREQKELLQMLRSQMGTPAISQANIRGMQSTADKSVIGLMNKIAPGYANRFGGTDSGQFLGNWLREGASQRYGEELNLQKYAAGLNTEKLLSLLRMFGSGVA